MELESDAKSEEKLICGLESNMRNLANFMGTFMGYFYPKQKMYELNIHMGNMCYDNEERCKIRKGIDQFKTDMRNLTNFDPSTRKSQKSAL